MDFLVNFLMFKYHWEFTVTVCSTLYTKTCSCSLALTWLLNSLNTSKSLLLTLISCRLSLYISIRHNPNPYQVRLSLLDLANSLLHSSHNYFYHLTYVQTSMIPWIPFTKRALTFEQWLRPAPLYEDKLSLQTVTTLTLLPSDVGGQQIVWSSLLWT